MFFFVLQTSFFRIIWRRHNKAPNYGKERTLKENRYSQNPGAQNYRGAVFTDWRCDWLKVSFEKT